MKKIKFLLLLLVIICFSSCTQCISTDTAIVRKVERNYNNGYNVYLECLNKRDAICYNSLGISEPIYFVTKNPTYRVGDTVKFLGNENN